MRRRIAPLLFAVAAVACARAATVGSSASSSPSSVTGSGSAITASPFSSSPTPAGSPSPPATIHGARTLGEADAGSTMVLHIGDVVSVELGSEYHQPQAQSNILARTSASGGYPTGEPARAIFRAVATGRTDITSSTDYACLHSTPPCRLPQRLWVVHVMVR